MLLALPLVQLFTVKLTFALETTSPQAIEGFGLPRESEYCDPPFVLPVTCQTMVCPQLGSVLVIVPATKFPFWVNDQVEGLVEELDSVQVPLRFPQSGVPERVGTELK